MWWLPKNVGLSIFRLWSQVIWLDYLLSEVNVVYCHRLIWGHLAPFNTLSFYFNEVSEYDEQKKITLNSLRYSYLLVDIIISTVIQFKYVYIRHNMQLYVLHFYDLLDYARCSSLTVRWTFMLPYAYILLCNKCMRQSSIFKIVP